MTDPSLMTDTNMNLTVNTQVNLIHSSVPMSQSHPPSNSDSDSSEDVKDNDNVETKKKWTRPDVRDRLLRRKTHETTCVVMRIGTVSKHEWFVHGIQRIVYTLNQVALEAYQIANYYLLGCLESDQEPRLDQSLFYRSRLKPILPDKPDKPLKQKGKRSPKSISLYRSDWM